ncbi:alanine racemase [bacterium]|nr:alanine racemase [bacterium]RQV93791.1 MAG: alanine racemase [bacterium]
MSELTWVEISKKALNHNIQQFRRLIGPNVLLCTCVKANAYGHGMIESSQLMLKAGVDWLSVNSLYEARALRQSGIPSPILIVGYVSLEGIREALKLNCRIVVYNHETVERIGKVSERLKKKTPVHIKVETGTNRQGVLLNDLVDFAKAIQKYRYIEMEGLSTHFANIEDTTDHSYAMLQIQRFKKSISKLANANIHIPIQHCANSAATLLFPKIYFQMVRIGISSYGMWPSNETYVSYQQERHQGYKLVPVLTWKTKIAQVKTVPVGEYIGYGCTYQTSHKTKLAILPVGYYDGYDRGISTGYVLIRGKRAPIRGRICMNMIMVEVTDIPNVSIEDEVILIGQSGNETISAEVFAQWAGTINYEVTTRINDRIPRVVVQ